MHTFNKILQSQQLRRETTMHKNINTEHDFQGPLLYIQSGMKLHTVFSIRVELCTKEFFSLTFLNHRTLYLLLDVNNLYLLFRSWLGLETMLLARLNMFLWFIQFLKRLAYNLWAFFFHFICSLLYYHILCSMCCQQEACNERRF